MDTHESLPLTEGHVYILMESLAEVSHMWEELGLALDLAEHILSDCREKGKNIIRLNNVLKEWIRQSRKTVTLETLKHALEGPLFRRPIVAQTMVQSFIAANSRQSQKSSHKQHLSDFYSVRRDVPADTWPPKGGVTFINLALINNQIKGCTDYNYSLRRDLDDVLASKEMIEYNKAFGQYESGALLLVEGRPGSGKTTLVHKVTNDWAVTGNSLRNASMVFHVPLRSLAKGCDENLKDILAIFYQHKEDILRQVCRDISASNGEGVCFIFDGLDEYQPQDESKSVIYNLIRKTYLPKSMVIVASRPVATATLHEEAPVTKQIEVLGFTQEQIFDYIDKFPFGVDASNLTAYLHSHHNILHMCYLPVHTAMICYLFREKGDIPSTETKIYEQFTRYIIMRQLRRTNKKIKLRSLEHLCDKNKEYFENICRLAFDMTIQSKQVIQQDDTNVPLTDDTDPDDTSSLGLVTIVNRTEEYGLDNMYSFLHLTFQEYLAALHLAKLKEDVQLEIIKLHAGNKHMLIVWKFYCGMVKFEGRISQIQLIMSSADPLHRAQCALESQQAVVCDHAIEGAGVLSYSGSTLTLADMTSIGYVISATSHPFIQIAMKDCKLDADHVVVLMREVSNKLKCIQTLDLSWNNIDADGARALSGSLKHCNSLQTLNLYNNKVGADGVCALVTALNSCNNLQTINLSLNNIGTDSACTLAEALESCINLQTLDLSYNKIGAAGAQALAQSLKSCNKLQTLDLYNNDFDAAGARFLAEAVKSCKNLQTLNLSSDNIGDDGTHSIAEALKSCNDLQRLNLAWNKIGDDSARVLSEALKSCSNLQTLDLAWNNIGDEGAQALTKALDSCNNLQRLDLSHNDIYGCGAKALVDLKCSIPDLDYSC